MPIQSLDRASSSAVSTNKVLRDTYRLLSITLLWSAFMAVVSYYAQIPLCVATLREFSQRHLGCVRNHRPIGLRSWPDA